MMVATVQISESLQTLIDSRLDTIDRMLLGRLSRQDRLAIVREVESQIHELLQERDADELTREDVLAVLARLTRPRPIFPSESETSQISRAPGRSRARARPVRIAEMSGSGGPAASWAWRHRGSVPHASDLPDCRRSSIRNRRSVFLGGGNLCLSCSSRAFWARPGNLSRKER